MARTVITSFGLVHLYATLTVCCRYNGFATTCTGSLQSHRRGRFNRWLYLLRLYSLVLQKKSLDETKKGSHYGEGQLRIEMALALAAGHHNSVLGFVASPAQV